MASYKNESGPGAAIARAIAIAAVMSVAMILMAFGFIQLCEGKADLPVSMAIVLIVFAISFIAAFALMERAGSGQTSSLIAGAAVALCATVFVASLLTGIVYIVGNPGFLNDGVTDLNTLLTGFAVCLVASFIINRFTLKL